MEFDTAIRRAVLDPEDEETYEFTIVEVDEDEDGREIRRPVVCRAYPPQEGQIVLLVADAMSRRSNWTHQLAAAIDFLTDVLDEESKSYIVGRLMDRDDPFGIEELKPIIFHLIEEWSGRPTRLPSDFSPSQKSDGQSSTRRTSKSTSSGSRSTGSSTRSTRSASAR